MILKISPDALYISDIIRFDLRHRKWSSVLFNQKLLTKHLYRTFWTLKENFMEWCLVKTVHKSAAIVAECVCNWRGGPVCCKNIFYPRQRNVLPQYIILRYVSLDIKVTFLFAFIKHLIPSVRRARHCLIKFGATTRSQCYHIINESCSRFDKDLWAD